MLAVASQEIERAKTSIEEHFAQIADQQRQARVDAQVEARKRLKSRKKKVKRKR